MSLVLWTCIYGGSKRNDLTLFSAIAFAEIVFPCPSPEYNFGVIPQFEKLLVITSMNQVQAFLTV